VDVDTNCDGNYELLTHVILVNVYIFINCKFMSCTYIVSVWHAKAQWLWHCDTNWKVAGSILDGATGFFH
jgi:hypothetical protein